MPDLPEPIAARIAAWPETARTHLAALRTLFHQVAAAADIGPLDESLKWGQPAWRPRRPRTGSTLRLNWSGSTPDTLDLFVDCKTDLAARVAERFPGAFDGDHRRRLSFPLDTDPDPDALWHLAFATFTYHRRGNAGG